MLLSKYKIISAVSNTHLRNELIKELDASPLSEPQTPYKLVLAFWLGSYQAYPRLIQEREFGVGMGNKFYTWLYAGNHLMLAFDKTLSILDRKSPAVKVIRKLQRNLVLCFNDDYELFRKEPETLFLKFKEIIDTHSCPWYFTPTDAQTIKKTKELCNHELSSIFTQAKQKATTLATSRELTQISNAKSSFGTIVQHVITASFTLYPYACFRCVEPNYLYQKIFVKAHDGLLLDGLYLKKHASSSPTLVLILIGRGQPDSFGIVSLASTFLELFGHDICLIKHRNYSYVANKQASSIHQLAQDVVSFVDYFRTNKQIVLYGHCGGAAHMILAANLLREQQIPFKLIVDRFAAKYSDVFDFKTQIRSRDHLLKNPLAMHPTEYRLLKLYPLFLLLWFIFFCIGRLTLYQTKSNIDFAAIIRDLPPDDVLILQAKSEKIAGQIERLNTDMLIHPANHLRTTIKDQRQEHKLILNTLKNHCTYMSSCIEDATLKNTLMEFASQFHRTLGLINDEKLKILYPPDNTCDIHDLPLSGLTTRNNLPMSAFVQGFFASPKRHFQKLLSTLEHCPEHLIIRTIKVQPTLGIKPAFIPAFAMHYAHFINELKTNAGYINYMANRLLNTGLGDLLKPLNELLSSDFYQDLKKRNNEQQASLWTLR